MNLEEIERLIFTIENRERAFLENYKEWSLLRNRLYMNLLKPKNLVKSKSKNILNNFFFANVIHGFRNWFRSYDVLVFTNNQYRKFVEGAYFDRVLDSAILPEEREKTLFISLTDTSFFPANKIYSKYVASQTILDLFGYLLSKFMSSKKIVDKKILDIVTKYQLDFNIQEELKLFNGYYCFYKFFFKIYKPKKIFVATYYSATRNYMVKAANDLKIPVIEGQHGYIGNAHPSYNCEMKLDKSYIPSELWVFSDFDKEILKEKGVYSQNQIKVKGDYFLDTIKRIGRTKNEKLEEYVSKYNYVLGVSLQVPLEDEIIPFFINTANINSTILYILIPRVWNEEYDEVKLPDNLFFIKEMGFYDTILWCTHHSTVFSTTAFEAEYLGVPNILVDIQGLATKYFGMLFSKESIVTTENQLVKTILK